MATLPQWMLRRLAPRALRVLERQAPRELALAAHRGRLGASAQAFIDAYDGVSSFSFSSDRVRTDQHEKMSQLRQRMSGWTPLLVDDLPGFAVSEYSADQAVADDLFQRAERLLKLIERQASEAEPLPYGADLIADLTAALVGAKEESATMGAHTSEEAELRRAARDAAATFNRDLVAFRRTLRAYVGRSHPDYQKLRVARVRANDTDDDETANDLLDEFAESSASAVEVDAAAEEAVADRSRPVASNTAERASA